MKKYLLNLSALVLAISMTAFAISKDMKSKQTFSALISKAKKTNYTIWRVFKYTWGPHDSPNSYILEAYEFDIDGYCPGNGSLCAILAEEDVFYNPGHPTQASLSFLLNCYGSGTYFPSEIPGLVEFKWWW